MDPQEIIRRQFLAAVDNQLRDNDPPATRTTYERLQQEGYSAEEARLLIAQCVAREMFEAMKSEAPADEARYQQCLDRLPEPPAE